MQTTRLTSFYILIISCIVGAVSFKNVDKTPIFGKCIDKELRIILKIVTISENGKGSTNPVEINREVENLMRMIKVYLSEGRNAESSGRRSRRFFFWPFRPWSFRPSALEGNLMGGIYGGYGPEGLMFGVGLNGGLQSRWKNYQQ